MTDQLGIEREEIWQSLIARRNGAVRIVGGGAPTEQQLAALLDGYITERRRHFEPEIGEVWQPDDWRDRLRQRFPGLDAGFDHGPGWSDILSAGAQMVADAGETMRMSYVKEKYGRMSCFPLSWFEGEQANIDESMEALSEHICEVCGAPGRNRAIHGWWRTECDTHLALREKSR